MSRLHFHYDDRAPRVSTHTHAQHRSGVDLMSLIERGDRIVKDWNWWSWFLARHYYGTGEERRTWDRLESSLVRSLGLQSGMSVLDLGCGCGEIDFRLAQRGVDMLGLDHSELLIEDCRRVGIQREIPAEFVRGDMFDLDLPSPFDRILSLNTSFGYGSDDENRELLVDVADLLNDDGVFYLNVLVADVAEPFGLWSDFVLDGTLYVDNSWDAASNVMTSWPYWISNDNRTVFTSDLPEVVRIYHSDEIEEMMRSSDLKPQRLEDAMGLALPPKTANQMVTWIATKG